MSTRAVIARKTDTGFTGVYHHWDGYPSGLGATLFEVCNKVFGGNTERMLGYLIDLHPAGWSTINADWKYAAGQRPDRDTLVCKTCGKMVWEHYEQYYKTNVGSAIPSAWERAGRPAVPQPVNQVGALVLGHQPDVDEPDYGPEPHTGDPFPMSEVNASGCGCEWAYVFDGNGKMEVQASYCGPESKASGQKMIGMFGCGDENAVWKVVAVVDLDGKDPDWKRLDKGFAVAAAA